MLVYETKYVQVGGDDISWNVDTIWGEHNTHPSMLRLEGR